ncbi:hypothetical protein GGR52DRAFT_332202 [Hypoxylon sp. FL1284]|nr:hypothetical protein GGR52DRAFT_332202 [Hypoxylon sp. FL1284]
MSSQQDAGVPLLHAPDGIGYKLLELPPELLALLESEDPPILRLESSANSAIIKSGAQSWSLRQKNTSNALIVLRSCDATPSLSSSQITGPSLKAVATVHDTVELVAESAAKAAPVARGKWHERFARGR